MFSRRSPTSSRGRTLHERGPIPHRMGPSRREVFTTGSTRLVDPDYLRWRRLASRRYEPRGMESIAVTNPIRRIREDEMVEAVGTPGIARRVADETAGYWFGHATAEPNTMSGWHHHGEHTTLGFVVKRTSSRRWRFAQSGDTRARPRFSAPLQGSTTRAV